MFEDRYPPPSRRRRARLMLSAPIWFVGDLFEALADLAYWLAYKVAGKN